MDVLCSSPAMAVNSRLLHCCRFGRGFFETFVGFALGVINNIFARAIGGVMLGCGILTFLLGFWLPKVFPSAILLVAIALRCAVLMQCIAEICWFPLL